MQSLWYIILVAVVLSVDAFTVSVANGIAESGMSWKKRILIAFFYGAFQFLMPVVGYFAGVALEWFISRFSHWISFLLLLFIGGKMVYDSIGEMRHKEQAVSHGRLTLGKLAVQAVATSIDALAVGITMLACASAGALWGNVWLDCGIIGGITFVLCLVGVNLGVFAGSKIKVPSAAQLAGGIVLILLGLKILLQGLGVITLGF